MRRVCLLIISLNCLSFGLGSYPCLCSFKTESAIYMAKSETSGVLGYMYEFDCKPTYPQDDTGSNDFYALQFQQQIGYIKNSPGELSIESCPGDLPDTDQVNPANSQTTITTAIQTTSETMTTTATTPVPTTTTAATTPVPTTTTATTTPVPTTTTVTTTPVPTTTTATTTPVPTTTTAATTPVPTTTTAATTPVPTTAHITGGCPTHWVKYHDNCYQFNFQHRHSQHTSSSICQHQGAHLVFIESKEEQNFLANHIKHMNSYRELDHKYSHSDDRLHQLSIWIGGIHTSHHAWNWVDPEHNTKAPLTYSNWWMHRLYHSDHDTLCAAMNGAHNFQWRDFRCIDHFFFICEKAAPSNQGPVIIG